MSYRWNPGWSGAVVAVFFVVFPALALVVRRKWKLAEVRRAEVMRLVRLAAAESERAEREAAAEFVYSAEAPDMAVAGGEIGMPHCAVCFSPTTTRCSRCKVVRYCSGSCQIIHWRQGHKYDCHPPLIDDHHKSQSNASDLKGVEGEISEPSSNGLDNEGRGHSNDGFYVDQSVSNKWAAKAEPYILVDSSLEREVKPDDAEPLEILSKKSAPLEANLTSEIHRDSEKYDKTNFVNAPDKDCSFVSTIGTSSSSCSTISCSVEMPADASSGEDLRRAASRQHAHANAHDHLEESFSSSSPGSCKSSVADADQTNDMIFPHTTAFATSLRHVSFSSDLKQDPTCINKETDFKLSAPSNKNIFSPSSVDARLCKIAGDCTPMFLSSINPEKSKTLISSESYIEGHGETLDLNAAETLIYAKPTEAQSCHNNHHPELDAGLHSELSVRLSSIKSSSAAASRGRSEYRGTMTPVLGKSGDDGRESNNEQLKSSFPTCPKDHSSSLAQGQSILRNASARVENVSPIARKSQKVGSTLPNGKVSAKRTVQLIASSSLSRHSQSGVFNYGYGKYSYKMFFPYDNFIKLYNSDKVDMRPCGMVNCGNSCYANSVLQCLAFTRPLAAFILEGLHAKACPKKGWCFTCEFETLLIKAKQGKSPLSPTGIISHIQDIGSNFSHGREEDAHEFLRFAIDAMQSSCLKEAGASAISELAQETTLIQLIFGGYLRSKIKCMRCQGKSEHRERMMDLTVDIHGDIGTLEEALARFTASEVLEGENKYKCDRCKSFERAKKQLTILEAPNVLTIALKRYQSGKYGKLNKMVQFPEYLNLGPYMRGSDDNSPVYRLYAVVVHIGHMNAFSGHYVCYVKNTQGMWFKADDSVVKQVELQKVLSQGAYMLLYARCSPRAPCLLRKEMAKRSKSNEHGECHNPTTTRPSSLSFHPRNRSSNNHTGHRTDDPSNFESHDLFDERFRRPSKVDPSSDSSSLFSYSDECSSWSTESTKNSATSEEFTEYGESGYMSLNSPCRLSLGSDGMPCSPNTSRRTSVSSVSFDASPLVCKVDKNAGRVGESSFQGRESAPILYSSKHHRSITESSSRSNTDWVSSSEVKSGVLFKRSSGERTTQTFY